MAGFAVLLQAESPLLPLIAAVVIALQCALPVFGWRYGKAKRPSWLGLTFRLCVVGTLGSWSVLNVAAHGFGAVPIPSLACLAIEYPPTAWCYPAWWLTLSASVLLFTVPFVVARFLSRKLV
jgi:hypothetical protein